MITSYSVYLLVIYELINYEGKNQSYRKIAHVQITGNTIMYSPYYTSKH